MIEHFIIPIIIIIVQYGIHCATMGENDEAF